MNLKILPLWRGALSSRFEQEEKYYKEVPAVYNRPGIYLLGDMCWFEHPNGKAYEYDKRQFKYRLEILEVLQRYNQRQVDAIHYAMREGVATKKQKRIMHMYVSYWAARRVNIAILKHKLRWLK